jgi:hypothetical protein
MATQAGNCLMKTALIAGTSFCKDNQQPSIANAMKVQRLDRKIVDPSGSKWVASLVDGDIVSSAW